MKSEPTKESIESENDCKSVSNDDIVRLVEKINLQYNEVFKMLAEIERKEREGDGEHDICNGRHT